MRKIKPSAEAVAGQSLRLNSLALAVAAALSAPIPIYAQNLPTGLQTLSGSVTVSTPTATSMNLNQASQNANMSAQSFSIGSGYRVDVHQPTTSSIMMMNVVGNNPSSIFGTLTANGQFWLVNTAGVLFGPTASVNVGGLVASTMPISYSDARSGRYVFTNSGNSGSVVNQGSITALNGYVGLFAPQVVNEGVIAARMGTVALAAGNQVSLDMVGDGLIKVSVDQAALNAAVMNKGSIEADGGNVLLTARSANALLDTVINTDGVIRANSIGSRNGTIVLDGGDRGIVSVRGTIEAKGSDTGTTGGSVKVLGQYVGLFDDASINASGDAGGGTVLVGGNFQGKGPEQNALRTYISSGSSINADAVNSGNGGKVIVWADDTTRFYGGISARGGASSGDGGFVEVSGKQSLVMRGSVDTRAPNGRTGTLLLDPATLNITDAANGTGTLDDELNNNTDGEILADVVDDGLNTVSRGQLEAFNATTNLNLEATGLITVENMAGNLINLATGAGNSFTLTSTTSGGIKFDDSADEIRTAGGAITLQALGAGGGSLTNIGKLTSNGGNITLSTAGTGSLIQVVGAINSSGTTGTTGNAGVAGGLVSITTADGNINTNTITTSGGTGGAANNNAAGEAGGDAGGVTITANNVTAVRTISLGAITAIGGTGSDGSPGDGKNGGPGGDGGVISVMGTAGSGASITLANITTTGGSGGAGSTGGGGVCRRDRSQQERDGICGHGLDAERCH